MENDFPEYENPQTLYCERCQYDSYIERKQCGPHLGAFCIHCKCKIRHLKKLKNLNKRKSEDYSKYIKSKIDKGYAFCAICYRSRNNIMLQNGGIELEIHHIREKQHEGNEDPENLLLVCQDCHKLIHSIRYITYRNPQTWRK